MVLGMLLAVTFCFDGVFASTTVQEHQISDPVPVYVDDNGIMRSTETDEEIAYFGVNYSPPFAHSYRAMKLLGKNHKEEIDKDVYHFARMGMDAFRIHIWDTEISDSLGNLIQNEHLDLLDYMLAKLDERDIKVILTPFTFYDNAYPDGATPTPGFANYISKSEAPLNPEFMPVLKRYLEQFLNHTNPYTGKTYREDPNIIATEIINEPTHGGDYEPITDFVNELADHVRQIGWEKPVFYNISQNPGVTDAVMNADIDGVAFQWYPGGLVGGEEIRRNYMPYIDEYAIPFGDKGPMQNKARMVYEFDSADLMYTYAYPLMARSFREAGFQWATQFAYDPLAIAFANSDYPTHYLNMIYTPAKSVSMLIASEVFRQQPLYESTGTFPDNMEFGDFRLSHEENLAEMNSSTAFYYTKDTETEPRERSELEHIAGTGNSPVVQYEGTGVYFLDKLEEGIWRLEVMPDVVSVSDPFEAPAFDKHVSVIEWHNREMNIDLPDLGEEFQVEPLNDGNSYADEAQRGTFKIEPGAFLLTRKGTSNQNWNADSEFANIRIGEYVAIQPTSENVTVRHKSVQTAEAGQDIEITATVAGLEPGATVRLLGFSDTFTSVDREMEEISAFQYRAVIPAESVEAGMIDYWISVEQDDETVSFPGSHKGSPYDWNYYHDEKWQIEVYGDHSPVQIFDARSDFQNINTAFSTWQNEQYRRELIATDRPGGFAFNVYTEDLEPISNQALGWSLFVADAVQARSTTVRDAESLVVHGKSAVDGPSDIKVILIDRNGSAFSASMTLSENTDQMSIPFSQFSQDKFMLLPRPYPPFMPFWFESDQARDLQPDLIEEIQILTGYGFEKLDQPVPAGFEIEAVWIQ